MKFPFKSICKYSGVSHDSTVESVVILDCPSLIIHNSKIHVYVHTYDKTSFKPFSLHVCSEPSLRCQPNDSTSREGLAIHLLHCPSDRDEVWPGGITTK